MIKKNHSNADRDIQLVAFKLQNEEYAFSILNVQEIITMRDIIRVPFAPEHIKGIVNLRGSVLPVVGLKKRLGMPETPSTVDARIIIVQYEDFHVGMLVDEVTEVLTIDMAAIDKNESVIADDDINARFISGVGKLDKRLIVILDVDELIGFGTEEKIDNIKRLV